MKANKTKQAKQTKKIKKKAASHETKTETKEKT